MQKPSELNDRPETQALAKPPEPIIPSSYYGYDMDSESEQGAYSRLHDYLRSARKHLWLILGIMVVVTTLVAFYMARQPDVYESQAHIQVDLEANNSSLGSKSNSFVLSIP